jgi:3-dehydroquinate synthase
LSSRLGWISAADLARVETIIKRARLPARAPAALEPARMLELMAVDKKAQEGRIRMVLLKAIGKAVVTADYDPALLREVLTVYRQG